MNRNDTISSLHDLQSAESSVLIAKESLISMRDGHYPNTISLKRTLRHLASAISTLSGVVEMLEEEFHQGDTSSSDERTAKAKHQTEKV